VKGQKKEILTRQESRHSSRPNVFYFLPTAHFLKQLPINTTVIRWCAAFALTNIAINNSEAANDLIPIFQEFIRM